LTICFLTEKVLARVVEEVVILIVVVLVVVVVGASSDAGTGEAEAEDWVPKQNIVRGSDRLRVAELGGSGKLLVR